MKKVSFLFILFSFVGMAQTSNVYLDSLTEGFRNAFKTPALAVAYVTPDSVYYGISGTTKINNEQKVSLQNKFHIGSNSKAITSFIAMKLVEQNKISFDTKFFDLFKEMKSDKNTSYHEITLGDLLSHNAKIQPYTAGTEFTKLPKLEGKTSENRKKFAEFVLNEAPVIKGMYSNAGYVLAALMLEKASGKSYEDLLKNTFSELGLDYFIGFPNKENIDNPWGHWVETTTNIPLDANHFYKMEDFMVSAGDISMNIVDYSKFIQLHLNGLFEKDNYLKTDSYKTLHLGKPNMAYGWGNAKSNGLTFSYHDGSAGTFYTHLLISHEMETAIIVFANSADAETQKGIYLLREEVMRNSDNFATK